MERAIQEQRGPQRPGQPHRVLGRDPADVAEWGDAGLPGLDRTHYPSGRPVDPELNTTMSPSPTTLAETASSIWAVAIPRNDRGQVGSSTAKALPVRTARDTASYNRGCSLYSTTVQVTAR